MQPARSQLGAFFIIICVAAQKNTHCSGRKKNTGCFPAQQRRRARFFNSAASPCTFNGLRSRNKRVLLGFTKKTTTIFDRATCDTRRSVTLKRPRASAVRVSRLVSVTLTPTHLLRRLLSADVGQLACLLLCSHRLRVAACVQRAGRSRRAGNTGSGREQ